jgi:hypothetical protein
MPRLTAWLTAVAGFPADGRGGFPSGLPGRLPDWASNAGKLCKQTLPMVIDPVF